MYGNGFYNKEYRLKSVKAKMPRAGESRQKLPSSCLRPEALYRLRLMLPATICDGTYKVLFPTRAPAWAFVSKIVTGGHSHRHGAPEWLTLTIQSPGLQGSKGYSVVQHPRQMEQMFTINHIVSIDDLAWTRESIIQRRSHQEGYSKGLEVICHNLVKSSPSFRTCKVWAFWVCWANPIKDYTAEG